jgi:DNA-binding transcriptional regulator YiaG
MYSVEKFAKMIGVASGTLRNWERAGKLIPLTQLHHQISKNPTI